jgi:hypothetical protein
VEFDIRRVPAVLLNHYLPLSHRRCGKSVQNCSYRIEVLSRIADQSTCHDKVHAAGPLQPGVWGHGCPLRFMPSRSVVTMTQEELRYVPWSNHHHLLVIALLGGFTGLGGGPLYGTGYYGGGLGLALATPRPAPRSSTIAGATR